MQVLRFIDIGGHEKYLKTALYGMTSLLPDYVLLCVNTLAHGSSLPRASREHLAVALALEIPLAVVLTQVRLPHALEVPITASRSYVLTASDWTHLDMLTSPVRCATGCSSCLKFPLAVLLNRLSDF